MVRVKRGTTAHKRRKRVLKLTKGYRWGRKSKYRLAKDALVHAWTHAFRDRKNKKRTFRGLWQIQINAAAREKGISYSRFTNLLKKNKIELNRKILAELGQKHPKIFEKIVEKVVIKKQTKKTA
ncbi:MAG: 50S ribosomal protein L20 [Patescibacteria group bacterium]|nr:50S ribosomal protein L20 [Patescibacteria group bacterium]